TQHASCITSTTLPPTETPTLSLHDALPIWHPPRRGQGVQGHVPQVQDDAGLLRPSQGRLGLPRHPRRGRGREEDRLQEQARHRRSEEHTSELQSPCNLVCRLLLEKKKHTIETQIRLSKPASDRASSKLSGLPPPPYQPKPSPLANVPTSTFENLTSEQKLFTLQAK